MGSGAPQCRTLSWGPAGVKVSCDRLAGFLDAASVICYVVGVVVRVPAVQDPRETSRNRNGDTRAGCGFFMTVRSCAAAFF
jgi:hypothetical protein